VSESELLYDWQFKSQSASLSWCQAPTWGPKPDLYHCQTVSGLLMWGAFSDERTGLSFTIVTSPCQCSHSWVRVRVTVTSELAVHRQSVHIGAKPLEANDLRFIQLNSSSHGPYVTPSDEVMNMLGVLSSVLHI
jgi:hypothetical protein